MQKKKVYAELHLPLYSNPMETIIKYFVTNLNKHTTQHQGRASRLLMLRVHTASDTATDLYLRNLSYKYIQIHINENKIKLTERCLRMILE